MDPFHFTDEPEVHEKSQNEIQVLANVTPSDHDVVSHQRTRRRLIDDPAFVRIYQEDDDDHDKDRDKDNHTDNDAGGNDKDNERNSVVTPTTPPDDNTASNNENNVEVVSVSASLAKQSSLSLSQQSVDPVVPAVVVSSNVVCMAQAIDTPVWEFTTDSSLSATSPSSHYPMTRSSKNRKRKVAGTIPPVVIHATKRQKA